MTRSQHAVLKLAQKRLGLDDDTYRAVLRIHGGVESAKALKPAGFKAVMNYFAECGFKSTWRERTYGDGRPGMASPAQIDTIRARWVDYAGRNDEAALNRWLERSFGVTALRFLDRDRAAKALTGLKTMITRHPDCDDSKNLCDDETPAPRSCITLPGPLGIAARTRQVTGI